ncbi:MAG: carboxypeptidase-like regulatory domain-containing protein [Cytophagales bacterium]|nr:carboxypeptidase-like regulatory domain-containing protein [Cytophagales bacterium]
MFSSIIFFSVSYSQNSDIYVEIKGTVVRRDSLTPIYGAAIFNKTNMLGTISNIKGNFKMRIKRGDTVLISHLSYHPQELIVHDTTGLSTEKILVQLIEKSYKLATIDVRSLRSSKYKNNDIGMRRTDNITYDMGTFYIQGTPYYGNAGSQNNIGLMSVGIPIWDPKEINREQQRRKVAELEALDRKKKYMNFKYNKNVAGKLTGLKGNELTNFMNFCKPSEKFLLTATDYDVAYYILDCYDKFIQEE